jgi:hypothetical protein
MGGVQQGLGDGLDGHYLLLHSALHRHQTLLEALDSARKLLRSKKTSKQCGAWAGNAAAGGATVLQGYTEVMRMQFI